MYKSIAIQAMTSCPNLVETRVVVSSPQYGKHRKITVIEYITENMEYHDKQCFYDLKTKTKKYPRKSLFLGYFKEKFIKNQTKTS